MKGLCHTCTIQKRSRCQKMTYTGATGTIAVGNTITGGTSHKTAIVTRLFTGYVVVRDQSGTFTPGEIIAVGSTWSATFGTASDYLNQQGQPEWYWSDNQTGQTCRFYYAGKGGNAVLNPTGDLSLKPLSVMLLPSVTIADADYRISTTQSEFAGTYDITLFPKSGATALHHYEAVLTKVPSP